MLSLTVSQTNHYLVLCPDVFFDITKTPSISTQLRGIREDPRKATDMYSLYNNLGGVYLHETYVYLLIINDYA